MKEVYFDNAATTKLDKEVLEKMMPYLTDEYGNASSIYKLGRQSRNTIEKAREKVAKFLNCEPNEIYFTSGGSESNNTAIKGIAYAYKEKGNHIITSKIEHPSVLETCKELEKEGFKVSYINVDENGIIKLDELKKEISDKTILITMMYANNEIGTIEPVDKISKIAKENNIIFHVDAVQAIGSIKIDVNKSKIDSLSLSAHKFYGPKGIGVLYVNKKVRFKNLINGGHQEKGKRAGTENVASIVGLSEAIEKSYNKLEENEIKIKFLRDYYESEVQKRIPYIKINGDIKSRLPGNSNISFKYIEGESLILNLDLKGIFASTGSACTSSSLDPSHVLIAIDLPHEIAHGSLRISIGKYNTKEEIDYLIETLVDIVNKLRSMSPLYEKIKEKKNV